MVKKKIFEIPHIGRRSSENAINCQQTDGSGHQRNNVFRSDVVWIFRDFIATESRIIHPEYNQIRLLRNEFEIFHTRTERKYTKMCKKTNLQIIFLSTLLSIQKTLMMT